MIPIRDTTPSKNYPVVNNCIIGINVVIFLVELSQGPGLDRFIYIHGLVPARYTMDRYAAYFSLFQQASAFFTFMFLHGGFWHLLGNMWCLYIFGDNVEDRLGHFRYLAFYLLCGLASGLTHLITNLHSNVPTIGASGAIAGVMGAYFVLHPGARILTLIPIFIFPWFVEIPAFIFLGFWFLLQFLNATGSHGQAGGIAWWAHVGGFLFGILFLRMFDRVPSTGVTERLRPMTHKRRTNHLQVVRPRGSADDIHLYADLFISPYESVNGARKAVNIPWGFYNRTFRIDVPPGTGDGKQLRLREMGKKLPGGRKGDLYLTVRLKY